MEILLLKYVTRLMGKLNWDPDKIISSFTC